uniref:Dystonin n=1 Tax=Scophthalmus maximus TaxID=52904 RepID=A0A8D3BVI5_SCOMX
MIAAAFLVLLRPYSIQCVLLLLLLLLGTIATILFFCCWHRRLRDGKHPMKSVLSGRAKSRGESTLRRQGFRHSPRHARRSIHARVAEEKPNLVEIPESEPDSSSTLRKRKVKKRVPPEFYQSVQVTPTRRPSSSSGNPSLHGSMSSSADFSDEDDYSVKSGSASPAPGDTLPWNLPRHERSKRKIQGGSVLDPAERAVLRIADERDRVQKKTFTKWINQHLLKVRKHINDLYEDLRDGHNLISLLEVLSGDTLPRERDFLKTLRLVSGTEACAVEQHGDTVDDDKGPRERGRMRFHRLQNVQIALDYLKRRQVKLVNIRNDDITDGNPKLTLGLIWTIILHFQISEIHVTGESEDMTAKERLLLWSKQITDGYVGVRCANFTTSWRDGRLFNAIIHKYRPDLVDMSHVSTQSNRSNLEHAFCMAEQLGVARLLDPEDVDVQSPDEKSVITYVSTLYDAFPKVPDGVDGINANDVDIKWVEYQNMIKYLSQWIKHNVAIMSDRSFPNNPVELKALYTQYLQFKEHEIPLKENEKTKIENLYKMLEMWIEFGRIHLPQGHHPNDVEKEWGKLIVAMLEREKSLRPEVERLEMLQQIANRVQRDCVNGEDKLALAWTALQSDAKRLESGIQFLHEAEIAGYLLECENILRQQVVDIQLLLDGRFPFADQLVQRVSKLRDDLLTLRAECSSVYSQGRTLTTEQTKMMISGITQSLNSGFSQNMGTNLTPALTPALTPGGIATPGSPFTSSLTPCLTPSLTPGLQPPSVQCYMGSGGGGGGGGGMDPGSLRHLKHMQIRKPLLKSSLADPNMTEEEVNMKYVQDLLMWVEDMQVQLDRSEWGSDLPSVETHLDNHKSVHRAIEEFQMSLKDATLSEIQMTIPLKLSYSDKLNKLEKQYERLLSCSRERQSHLENLLDFVSQATQELIWLNEKEEEEVAFDWSDRNSNISKKRDYHADLMRELDEKEVVIKSVQDKAERLMFKNHPAKTTIEAYRAAMQTQWSWILQLCSCVERHLKENAVYFEYFRDAKESIDYLKSLQDAIQRKYSCDRTSSLHRLEDLIQESMDEKEQLLQYRSAVAGLVGRAKNIVQLRPRNPESPVRSSIPVKAICDYRQIEITIYKDDECVLASNSHRAKWKVINPAGNEAMVPSVCFTVPPPNKEAVDKATRTEQLYQNVLALWHHSHINMKSVVSWHYLMADVRAIRNWNVASIKTMLPGEHQQVLSNMQSHFDEFLEDSEESEVFTVADCAQLEGDVTACKEYYQELLRSAEREEHEESVYNNYISEIRNFRMHLEAHEEHLIRQIRTPLERDDLEQSLQRITEHERKTAELNKVKEDLDVMKEKCELFLRQAAGSSSVPTLSSELTVLVQSMSQVYSMSSIYMDKLKTVSLVVKHSQSAEALVKAYESKLYEEDAMNSEVKSIETVISTLKQWRTEIDEKQEVFHDMEDELQKARAISDRMFKAHNERDFDLDWHKEKADQLSERWQNIHSQIDCRLRDLDGIDKSLKHYRDSYSILDEWVREMEVAQLKAQENKPEDSKALAELLNKQKVLVAEIEQKQSRIDECQKYSEQYSSAIKDYELQLMTFRAMVDSQHKSPLKKRRMQSSSDAIQQEFMDLRTRYTALVTLMTQYVKFASETLKRTEDEEVRDSNFPHFTVAYTLFSQSPQKDLQNVTYKGQINPDERSTVKTHGYMPLCGLTEQLPNETQRITRTRTYQIKQTCETVNIPDKSAADSVGTLSMIHSTSQMLPELKGSTSIQNIIKFKLIDEEVLHKLEMGLITREEVQAMVISFLDAAEKGFLAKTYALEFLEAQAATGSLTDLATGKTLSVVEALERGIIETGLKDKLVEAEKAISGYIRAGKKLSVFQAMEERVLDRYKGKKILEVQVSTGGLINPDIGVRVPVSIAVEQGLLDKETLQSLNKPLTPGRNVSTLRSVCDGLSDQETLSRLLGAQLDADGNENGDRLKVDAAIQCDLMSSSSTLTVLGNQQQFMGLVLPHSGEIQTVSTSFHYHEQLTTNEYTSSLFSDRQKIAAFYIPENSEIVDIASAIENSLTDNYTTEVLKSIELPDVFPDVDHLYEKFSSWLMYKKLTVDGCHRAAESIKVDNIPSTTEARQMFISYLMMNSFIDPKSGQRVLILDRQLNETVKIFLEDLVLSENTENNVSSLTVTDVPEQLDIPLLINEETEGLMKNAQYTYDPMILFPRSMGELTSMKQISVSGNEIENAHKNDGSECCLNPRSESSNVNSGRSETRMKDGLGSVTVPDRNSLDLYASEYPQIVSDFLSDGSNSSAVASSAPAVFSNDVRTCVDDQEEMGTNVSDLSPMLLNTESPVAIVQKTQQPLGEGDFHERDMHHGLLKSSHSGLPVDFLEQSTPSLNNKEQESVSILQEERVHEETQQSDAPNIQLQLLQVLKTLPRVNAETHSAYFHHFLFQDAECNLLKETRLKLEDVTFDIQCFISEQAQFLSAAQSSCLLKLLSTTQRTLRDQTERLVSLLERHKEFTEKLEEVCDNLTLTENRLIGHQQQTDSAESVTDLQQYQQEHQALQKDVLTNASALNEVITSTKKFLEENRNKLTPDQIAIAESKLEEAKSKAKLINQRAEESRKDLEKVVTTAIKQESEKAAAVERLEESKNKIEGLLDWISNIGSEKESGLDQTDHISKENGNLPEETSAKGLMGENDDANGNALQSTGNDFGREARGESDASLDLDKQYDRVKAHHQEILSQQQDLIMATQSAQALLDKQADVLSAEEKEKLQRNIQELKGRYEASLTQAEQQMKQVHCVQEELKKFQDDCEEFGGWLDQAEGEMEELGAPAGSLNILSDKLQRQKSFSEDVISHKGDLRFITISGQKVLDVAKACGLGDPAAKNAQLHVDTSGTCSAVKEKLDSAAGRYKTLHSQCNQLGNNLKDVVDKYKKYDDSSAGLLKWLNSSEEEARKQQSEAIAADPQTLQKQLEETKALQGQMTGHQTAVDTLRKTTESLVTCEGDLLSNPDEIQETVDDIVERYDNLSKSVSDRNEKLQITLTRSMSVQDGLDEMMAWMEGVEASVKEKGQIPLDSASIGDILSKEAALEQDIASRQSSISAMKDKVKKFAETADSSAAALLQSNMEALSQRFSDACDKHKQKVSQLEQLKEKVEQFETVAGKVQQFVVKRSQDLHETDGPGKTFNELSQLMQSTKAEMAEHASDVEKLQTLSKELSELSPDGNKAQIQSKMDNLLNIFTTFKDTVKEKEEEVSSCQDQLGEFRSAANALTKWLEETNEKVPAVQPSSSEKSLEKDLQTVTVSHGINKASAVERERECSVFYLAQNVSFVNEGYASLGETLKSRATELSSSVQYVKEAQKETADMMTWLKDMKKTAASWNNAATEKESVKTQLEQQKAFEDDMKQKQERHQKLREKLLNLIKTHPNSPEAAKWKQMLAEIDAAWTDISGSVEQRKQHLEQSNKNLDIFQTTELQLGQWLSEKELMMSVLGPLSIDLNMLKMQKQQVQILQNEFKSRKPQYEQLEEAASAILSSSGNQDPSNGKLVREKLAAITQKWQGITGQLDQRDSLIDQAVVKTGQFQELLRSLGHTASQLENQLTNHQGHSTQPDAVKKQLEDVHNISAQLREERKTLKEAEAINTELTAMVTEDYLKADLARQLESVSKPFKQLEEKQLNSTFASSQQFHQTSKDFQSWLGEKLQDQSKPQAISAKVDILHQTLEEHSKLQQALGEHEEVYNTILGEGEMLLQSTDGAEKLALQGQLTALSSNWDEVKRSSVEQAGKLQTALQRSLKYQEHAEKLSSWIQECEASEGRVKLTVDPAAVESSISQVKVLQKDVDKSRRLVEQLDTAADSLLEVANVDTQAVKEEKASIGKRVDSVAEGLQSKRESLEMISHTVKEFNDTYKEAKGQLEGAKKQVDAYKSQGVQGHSNKNLTNMKAQHKSLEGVQNQVEHLKSMAKDLVVNVPDADGVTDLLLHTDSIENDYSSLNKILEETCQVLEGKLQGIGQFQISIREMYTRFTDLDDELDSMAPVDLDLATLSEQRGSIQSFVANCKKMLETETSPDLLGLKRDLDALSKQCGKLSDRAKGREVQVQSTFAKLEELYGKLHRMEDELCRAVDKEATQGAVGMETDVINQQLEAFKAFQKEDIDPLQTQLQDINSLGQGLIQNAAKGTSTKKLDDDLEGVNTKWNTLNKKIAERSAQLHEALLHCGRFQDALESLLSWLTDTEELVANQKPPSAEFKVVKAQIQEQKLLQRLLDDRKPTVELIKKEGGKVAELAESVDKEKVAKEIECLGQRWDALLKKAENRSQLESILVVTQQFHETLEPLSEWLAATEKHLANSEPTGTETSKLQDQICQHKGLQSDIELRKRNVDQAISNGMELLKQTTGDEVVVIQGKLDGIKAKYAEINSMSDNVLKTLERVLSFSSKLHHNHEDLSSWLEKVEAEIRAFADQEPVGDQLIHAQSRQKALLKETKDQKPVMDKLNELSSSLLDLIPWHTREGLDKLVTDDNERYRAVCDTITQQVDQINADILKSQQFEQAADTELSWLTEAERKLLSMGEIRLEQDQNAAQLQAQKIFSMDVMRHKDAVDEIVKNGKAIMNSKNPEEKEKLKAKTQTLLEKYGTVSQLNSERCLQLERTQSLASQFWETYEEMWPWLQETLSTFSQLPPPSIEYDRLRQQQEELRQMRELIAEHKPHIDKMNKTGPQLLELSPVEGVPIREKYTATDQLYIQLKADVKQRAATLDEAISKSTQFHDKIDPMLESLERIAERLRQPPSISVEVDKIREQITENKAVYVDLEKLQPSYETLRQRGEEMIARSEGADKDIYAKAVQDQLDQMVFLWSDIQALLVEREAKLLDVMDLADKFWCDHCALIVTIKDSQDLLRELEEPGVDPSVVKQQQEFVEVRKEEIDGLQEELDVVQNQGAELMTACGEPDKPVIKKSIDEVNSAWENLNKTWKERGERLEEAMQAAVQFQDGLQGMFDWVDIMESKLDSMSPVGTDLETVKQQIVELKEFKGESYQLQIEMERLNHQAGLLLKKVTEEADRCAIQEPMSELRMLWENLDEKIISRQHKLEGGLLALGQFQHALDELLAWMSHTEELLDEQRKAGGDPKAIEIELAKHHVLQVDVLAHKATVETVNKAGTDLVESSAGEEAAGLQTKLENLNQRWKAIQEKTKQRKQQLESSLLQAQGFHGEIEDMQQWLKDTERQLLASKAVGGLPDTAREQLNAHLELCSALEAKEELCQELLNKGHQLLAMTPEGPDSNTEQDLANLREKWEAVQGKVAERKAKLEEALTLATDFHNSLQDFINWLTQAEQTLNMVSPASLILETIMFQIDEHKVFVTEVNSHREHIIELDKTGTHLKYFSQKQDVVLIKNLLLSVQGRWEKVVQRSVERGRLLDDSRKRAKQFHETWNKLMEWLDESEKTLDSEVEIANDPDKIKTQLAQHKEFQKALGSKHSVYDTTARTGRALKDKTSLQDDNQKLDDMLSELRDKWDTVCGKSVERQNKLEEALLFSGQFTDALQALIDWLYRVEPQLAEDQPVHGDIDLVLNLIDNHKAFQKELGKRTVTVQALKRSARELVDSSHADSSWVKVQMQELSTRWETVCNLSVSKQARLEQALCQAEEFHSTVHILLEWLAEAEQSLRFHGSLPDDEEALRALIEQHKEFMKKLEEKRVALNKATSMGEAILSICHPDSITTIKHWNTIIKARFDEVQAWARQHQQRLATALTEMLATQDLLENLLTWLQWAETNLNDKDNEPLPQELEEVKGLIAEHQAFMEEMTRKQPDVDTITKTHKRKAAVEPQIQSHIPVLEKGRTGRKRSPTQTMYASATQAPIETKNPRVNLLVTKWQHVWLLALDRRRKLNDGLDRLEELKEFANFDFDVWRKRYMRWMNHKKSRVMDFFRRIDKDQDGKVTRQEFIEGILSSKFPTSRLEMSAVADIFDRDGDGYIDYYEFVAALHPNKDAYKPLTDADKIEDEVTRQVAKCKCPKRFQVEQIGANKYRFYLGNQFGDSQQLRLVRILRSTVMVRVGGGWMALDEFLVKNDPCRVHHHGSKMLRSESNSSITQSPIAKGRTNLELREKFILPEGTTQVMASFRYRGRRSRPSSRGASPNRSTSSQSCPVPPNPVLTSTPKMTPVHGSKLRLPGYLSGKGFQSGEEGTLISAAVLKARTQTIESRRNSSRPGSKAGSRGSSRRGSDASDFDISDIQSVCSDASETVGESARATPRSASRQRGGKPSKIPTPQRRTTPTSKLAKGSKR